MELNSSNHFSSRVNSIHKEHNPSKIKVLKNTIFFNSKIGTVCVLSHFNHVWLLVTLQTAARQAPQSMGFSREEYWSGLPCSPPGDLPNPRIEPRSPALQVDSLSSTREAQEYWSGYQSLRQGNFPGSLVAKIPCSQCRVPGVNP